LEGLEKEIKFIYERVDVKENRWPDLNVAPWPKTEILPHPLQTDWYAFNIMQVQINMRKSNMCESHSLFIVYIVVVRVVYS
jgi:hypothetical protein